MKFNFKYFLLIIFLSSQVACASGCFSFRKSESKQMETLEAQGQKEPQFQTLTVNDRTIHFLSVGEKDLPLVIFVHGSPGSGSDFISYLGDTTLSQKVQMVGFDRPGFGYSDYGKSCPSLANQAACVNAVIQAFPEAPKVILVGHSMGGPVIARTGIDYPNEVDGLLFLAASVDPKLEPKGWYRKPLDFFMIRWMLPGAFRSSNQEIMALEAELEIMEKEWGKIIAPAVIIQGMDDNLVPWQNATFAKKQLINAPLADTIMLANQNHFIVWSEEALIKEQILRLADME